jgi:hypothetical protein
VREQPDLARAPLFGPLKMYESEFSALSLYDSVGAQGNALGNAYLLALSTAFYRYAETKASE